MTVPQAANMYAQTFGTSSTRSLIPVIENRDPTATDVNYPQSKEWINQATGTVWVLTYFTTTAGVISANWTQLGVITGAPLNTLTGDVGAAIVPDGANNINIQGGGAGAIQFSNGGVGQMDAQVLVDNATITISANQLTAFNTSLQTIGPTNVAAPFDALGTIIPIPAGSAYYFEADVIGSDGAGLTHVVGGKQQAIIQNLGGVISIIGLQNQFYAENPSPVPAGQQDFEFVTAVGGARLRVFGFNGVAMNFKAKISYVAIP